MSGWVWKLFTMLLKSFPVGFALPNFALKWIPGLVLIWVTPEVLHEDYPQAYGPGAGGVGGGPGQAPDSKNRGPDESIHTP